MPRDSVSVSASASATASPVDNKQSYPNTHTLIIRQQPENARVAVGKEKDRKPIDPPPILQLNISPEKDPHQHFLQSPYFFMTCTLVGQDSKPLKDGKNTVMVGSLASSLHKLKDTDNSDGGFFIFPDLSVKQEGSYRLQFTLFELQNGMCSHIASATSEVFTVWPAKTFPGMAESTSLTRSFSDQGVRLRLRKDSRSVNSRKRSRMDDYSSANTRYAPRPRTNTYEAQSATLPRIDSTVSTLHDSSQSPQDSTPRQTSFSSPYGTSYDRLSESRSTVSSVSAGPSSAGGYYYTPSYVTSTYPTVTSTLGLGGMTSASVPASMYQPPSHMGVPTMQSYNPDPYGQHESPTFNSTHELYR